LLVVAVVVAQAYLLWRMAAVAAVAVTSLVSPILF
jgi:hypothetical protein